MAGVGQDTVADYVHLLEETHILRLLRPFVGGKRAELTRRAKVYFVDNGIRNLVLGGFAAPAIRSDLGPLLENFALSEISKSINPLLDSVKYWRTKSGGEVDFVVEHQGRVLACEIKAGDTRSRLSRAARSFIDAYQPEQFVIVGRHAGEAQQHGNTTIRFIQMSELAPLIRSFAETSLS